MGWIGKPNPVYCSLASAEMNARIVTKIRRPLYFADVATNDAVGGLDHFIFSG